MDKLVQYFGERADRLINQGWLTCIADLTRRELPGIARDMLDEFGFSRDDVLASSLQPYDMKRVLALMPETTPVTFVNANDDPRVTRVFLTGPRGLVSTIPESAQRGDI